MFSGWTVETTCANCPSKPLRGQIVTGLKETKHNSSFMVNNQFGCTEMQVFRLRKAERRHVKFSTNVRANICSCTKTIIGCSSMHEM